MYDILETVLRTSASLLTLLIMTRIMGRKSVAQLSFFDYVVGISIGSIAGSLAVDPSIEILRGLASLGVATLWVLLINALIGSNPKVRELIESVPVVVIYKGQILEGNLSDRYYNVNDLLEQLREQQIFDPNEVEVAIAETDGQLSVLKKPQFQAPVLQDLTKINNDHGLVAGNLVGKELIIDGKIIRANLLASGYTEEWLRVQLQAKGISQVEEVTLALVTPQGDLYIDQKNDVAPDNLRI
jgi:uncharacterized membrane protein YcaP (DUF421 family)